MGEAKSGNAYKPSRRLGILNPPEDKVKKKNQKPISQVTANKIMAARNEVRWSQNDLQTLKAASLCKLSHYYRALQADLKEQGRAPIDNQHFDREAIVLHIMMGLSVQEAFRKCCSDSVF